MIFKQWQQVLDGTKTQTRRPAKWEEDKEYTWVAPTPTGSRITEVVGINNAGDHKLKWAVGKTYAVQPGRGKKSVGRIRITKIRRERLHQISGYDVVAEGTEGWAKEWDKYIGDYFRQQGWASFRRGDLITAYSWLWKSIYKKPYRWEDNPEVWVLEFERCEE